MAMRFRGILLSLGLSILLPAASIAGPFSGLDSDGDGVDDVLDNCMNVKNANQVDADGDGCGNRCDADYDNTGLTTIGDFATYRICNPRTPGAPGGPAADPLCLESDMDGSGVISIGDFNDFKNELTTGGATPGPSGSPIKAGPPACP